MATINELDAAIACGEEAVECARLHQNNGYDAVRLRLDEIALEALQDARRRAEGCEWCKHHCKPSHVIWDTNTIKVLGDPHSLTEPFMKIVMRVRIGEGEIEFLSQAKGGAQNQCIISVHECPNCGRALRGEKEERE